MIKKLQLEVDLNKKMKSSDQITVIPEEIEWINRKGKTMQFSFKNATVKTCLSDKEIAKYCKNERRLFITMSELDITRFPNSQTYTAEDMLHITEITKFRIQIRFADKNRANNCRVTNARMLLLTYDNHAGATRNGEWNITVAHRNSLDQMLTDINQASGF